MLSVLPTLLLLLFPPEIHVMVAKQQSCVHVRPPAQAHLPEHCPPPASLRPIEPQPCGRSEGVPVQSCHGFQHAAGQEQVRPQDSSGDGHQLPAGARTHQALQSRPHVSLQSTQRGGWSLFLTLIFEAFCDLISCTNLLACYFTYLG